MNKPLIVIGELILVSLIVVCQSSCQECSVEREFNHVSKPERFHGWEQFQERGMNIKGDFVLALGESTNNGKIGVKVIGLTSARCSLTREPEVPTAKIQFFNIADRKVICEGVFRPGGARLNVPEMCGEGFDWAGIGVSAINAKEKWVAFQLD